MDKKIKNSLKLYLHSWKHSFDFNSKETAGEYKNFILINILICLLLFVSFFPISTSQSFSINSRIITFENSFGIALFWCYMSIAFIPLCGLFARRLHTSNIDITIRNILKIFNSNKIAIILYALVPLSYFISLFLAKLHYFLTLHGLMDTIPIIFQCFFYFPYLLNLVFPIYTAFIPLSLFCWYLFNTKKLKNLFVEKTKQKHSRKKTITFLALFLLSIPLLIKSFNYYAYILIPFAIYLYCMFIIIKYYMYTHFICILAIFLFSTPIKITILLTLILAISYKKIKSYLSLYIPMILVCIILPLNICATENGSLGIVKNILASTKYVEQKIDSFGDKNINSLSIPLLQNMLKESPTENSIISAHNLYQGLSILANGATGNTLEHLKQLLGSQNLDEINTQTNNILTNHSSALKFKNKLTITNKKHLNQQIKKLLKNYNIKTNSSNNNCEIEYSSTLSFASLWKDKFSKNTKAHPFYTPKGIVQTQMMYDTRDVDIAQGPNFIVLALPYKSGDIFYIILPDAHSSPDDSPFYQTSTNETKEQTITLDMVIENLTPTTLSNLKFEKHNMDIMIPVFEFSENIDLKNILTSLGLENLFKRGKSELNNILSDSFKTQLCDKDLIHLSDFKQQNSIKVDQNGTTAISIQTFTLNYATGVSLPKQFIVDRPFIFMINNGAFIGIVNDPTKKDDSVF